jgi:hypothetical protein
MTMWSAAALTNYVCADCGYLERYVQSPDDRTTMAGNWEKVAGRGAKA